MHWSDPESSQSSTVFLLWHNPPLVNQKGICIRIRLLLPWTNCPLIHSNYNLASKVSRQISESWKLFIVFFHFPTVSGFQAAAYESARSASACSTIQPSPGFYLFSSCAFDSPSPSNLVSHVQLRPEPCSPPCRLCPSPMPVQPVALMNLTSLPVSGCWQPRGGSCSAPSWVRSAH